MQPKAVLVKLKAQPLRRQHPALRLECHFHRHLMPLLKPGHNLTRRNYRVKYE
jgi:hypothetical protein